MTNLLKLKSLCENIECEYQLDAPMKNVTTFQIGGACDILVRPYDEGQAAVLIKFCFENGMPYFVMGNGSNLLVPDGGISGAVIQMGQNFSYIRKGPKAGEITCAAGASLSAVSAFAQKEGLTGLEFAWGIPGNVGGALCMNAGAYGGEMKQVVRQAEYIDEAGKPRTIGIDEMQLGYRRSVFLPRKWCITKVTLALNPGDPDEIKATMDDYMARRKDKQPLYLPSAGSVFKRPEGAYAGELIERCGLKGKRIGAAEVSTKHAGFIVNTGGASSRDVVELIREVQKTVKEQTGYNLECELRLL